MGLRFYIMKSLEGMNNKVLIKGKNVLFKESL